MSHNNPMKDVLLFSHFAGEETERGSSYFFQDYIARKWRCWVQIQKSPILTTWLFDQH